MAVSPSVITGRQLAEEMRGWGAEEFSVIWVLVLVYGMYAWGVCCCFDVVVWRLAGVRLLPGK